MANSDSHSRNGWRRAAQVNIAVLVVITVTMFCFLMASISREKTFERAYMFFAGTCDGGSATQINVGLHLMLNVVSTAIFASSHFFMQVLNSPSRREVDAAHAAKSRMSIGVPSIRNIFRVSRFETCCWVVISVSSIPIHLLFNSMVFETDNRSSDYQLAIANPRFVQGAQYYAPGAALTPSGFFFQTQSINERAELSWGYDVSTKDYTDPSSEVHRNISTVAANSHGWDKISATDCYYNYAHCSGIKAYRNVVIVPKVTSYWVRDELWDLKPNETAFWDSMVPGNESNSLWFAARCDVSQGHLIIPFLSLVSNQGYRCVRKLSEPVASSATIHAVVY
jgi:hypothetical protein